MNNIRSRTRALVHRFGFERITHPSIVDFIRHERIETVFDVGANEGHYAMDLRAHGFSGKIVSFEPIETVHRVLLANRARDEGWSSHQIGLGDEEHETEITVSKVTVFSSLKSPTNYTTGKFMGAGEARRETVQVKRLDEFLQCNGSRLGRAFLKIDTQGFEKEVLLGAGAALSLFQAVQLELALRPLYEGQDTIVPMINFMSELGFDIAMAKENGFDWQAMRLLELDVVFARRS